MKKETINNVRGKRIDSRIAQKIYAYIHKHFDDSFSSGIKQIGQGKDATYNVEVDSDGIIYYLKFNAEGVIKRVDTEITLDSDRE